MVTVIGTEEGLDYLLERIKKEMPVIVHDAGTVVRKFAFTFAPRGVEGNSTNYSGDMADHLIVSPVLGHSPIWWAEVGSIVQSARPGRSTVWNYSRQREFGGVLPRLRIGSLMTFKRFGVWSRKYEVTQEGSHFLLRARLASGPEIELVTDKHLAIAIEGG